MTEPTADAAYKHVASKTPLFFQRRFLPMWTALSLGTFADNTLRQALLIGIPAGIISVPFFSNPDDAIPYIGALLPLGILIFSSISGQLADKYETSFMFRRTKATEILLMSVAAFAFIADLGGLAIAMLFAMGAQSAFFSPVRVSAMPKYLNVNELVRGNALCNAGLFTFILVGYVAGGFLIVLDGGNLFVGAILVSAAFFGWLAILKAPEAGANDPDLKINLNGLAQTAQMFRFVVDARGVVAPFIGIGAFYMFSTTITVLTPLYGRDSLYADPLVWTALNGFFAIGAGIGALCAASLAKSRSGLGFSTVAITAAGFMMFVIFALTPLVAGDPADPLKVAELFTTAGGIAITVAFVATSALSGIYIAPLQAALQRRAPSGTRARIMAASIFANAAFAIPGSLSVLGITRTGIAPHFAFPVVGVAMIAIGAVMFTRQRTLPAGLYDEMLAKDAHEHGA